MTQTTPPLPLCDSSAEIILSGNRSTLSPSDPRRIHISGCSECRERLEEVAFFTAVFGSDSGDAFLVKEPLRVAPVFRLPAAPAIDWPRIAKWARTAAVAAAVVWIAVVAWDRFQPEGIGRVAQVHGEASIRRFGERDFSPLREGAKVHPGDQFRTEAGATARLVIEDENAVYLNESTQVRIEEPRELDHDFGETWFEIAKGHGEFEVETRGANVLVLGTAFGVVYSEGEVTVSVESGKVRLLTKGGDLELEPGQVGSYSSEKPYLPPVREGGSFSGPRPDWVVPLEAMK